MFRFPARSQDLPKQLRGDASYGTPDTARAKALGTDCVRLSLDTAYRPIQRCGFSIVASPRHADMLLVTGPVTRNMELALLKTYRATPEPNVVVAVGACGISGGIFGVNYASLGGVDKVVPVDVYIPGCPPRPHALLHGILLAVGRLEERLRGPSG